MKISSQAFYNQYFGHPSHLLSKVVTHFNKYENNRIVYLAGDSTLDNKFWIKGSYPAINGYEEVLSPSSCKGDFAYYLNNELIYNDLNHYKVVNCAREASSFTDKEYSLCEQDIIIRENIKANDVLIVSIGGNDLALVPSISLLSNFIIANYFNRASTLENNPEKAWGLSDVVKTFRVGITKYIKKLIRKTKPSKVIICMVYYPDTNFVSSWCGPFLTLSGYSFNPSRIQAIIKHIYNEAICNIKLKGVETLYFPMFEHLDANDTTNYVGRVEPSELGTEKLSKELVKLIVQ